MAMSSQLTLVALVAACTAAAFAQSRAPERAPLETLLTRAAWYLDYFVDQFENVVAEETYIQDASALMPIFNPVGGGRGTAAQSTAADMSRARHRDLKSDFLLVKSPTTPDLVPFRDVLEVDGRPVRDREQRLANLFIKPSTDAMAHAERVRDEGARYNLGNMRSTIGNPMLALGILQVTYQPRFHFSLGKEDKSVGAGVWIVEYKEDAPPAMIRGEAGGDLFSHGRLWVELATGRVMKTELQVEQPSVRAIVTTTFRYDDRFGIAVPMEMRERYTIGTGNRVNTVATYGRFRRFTVSADEDVRVPLRTVTEAVTGMTLIELPAGRYTMGSGSSEIGRNADETLHDVEITQPFFLGRYEVTQEEWRAVMGTSPSQFAACRPRCPVENVTFADVQQFLAKLNANPSATLRYRLPTEAEWEYACRAGTTGPFFTGENLTTDQANYNGRFPYPTSSPGPASPMGEFRQRPTPVGSFPPNRWGLADMHGNVWEWTADWYGAYAEDASANIDPHGPPSPGFGAPRRSSPEQRASAGGPNSGEKRVIRGGSWYFDANSARCALRYTHAPEDRGFSLGFRLAADRK
jgi:formylglycine-generating enzyme required for sulfatase activity